MPQCYRNDALHNVAIESIRQLKAIHQIGSGKASLEYLAQLFGFPLSANDFAILGQRGDVQFTRASDNGGTFNNTSGPLQISASGMKISVPREICGSYEIMGNGYLLSFDDDKTISGSFLLLRSRLEGVEVDDKQIKVDLSGDSFDQCILHG